jgi:hypothetical protein
MPNSQGFLRFIAIASRGRRDRVRERETPRSRREGEPCCDAPTALAYTFP